MFNKKRWDERVTKVNEYLNHLYFTGKLRLSDLQSFRRILNDMDSIMTGLLIFGNLFSSDVRKSIVKMNGELTK